LILGGFFAPLASDILLRGQKKVTKEKAAPTVWPCGLPCAPRHFGRARNSLRSDSRALLPKMAAVLGGTDGDPQKLMVLCCCATLGGLREIR